MSRERTQKTWAWYWLSVLFVVAGGYLGARAYPGGFDWAYEVMSALASQKHNPEGGHWFAGGLALGMACLFPVGFLFLRESKEGKRREVWFSRVILGGIFFGVLVGLERLFVYHISDVVHKAHEILALFCFLSLFIGILGLTLSRTGRSNLSRWSALWVVLPLMAIGLSQLALYFDQRDLGWVDTEWRTMGIPVWYSFAFWQWLAAVSLWISLGLLLRQKPQRA
ncbi:DUF998 domain-containing protein [Pelagicoccus albus]|uniref:DUF998 domain-containing protein n=1 Tax=Pelagicoccus albus TaxID=415222 RepID=A0A7X1E945_9BACT|nr:DUF998 domain-containing protein [Pelagicoccus albus]